tara:strand:- start:35991 stop:36683 length:693 start_codon:yes stop_codon:yes gene_type:complete
MKMSHTHSSKNNVEKSSQSKTFRSVLTVFTLPKFLSLLAFVIFTNLNLHGQAEKGNYILGADIGSGITTTGSSGLFGVNFGLNEGAGFNLGLSPKAGYFLTDNFLIGTVINFGYIKSPETNGQSAETIIYGLQGFLRYYLRASDYDQIDFSKRGAFFTEINGGIAGSNVRGGNSTNGFAFGLGPGYGIYVTDQVALEVTAKYNGLIGGGNTIYQHSFGLNIGIQIFLRRK